MMPTSRAPLLLIFPNTAISDFYVLVLFVFFLIHVIMTQKRYKGIVFFLIAQILGKKNVGGGKFIGKRVLIILLSGANYGVICA